MIPKIISEEVKYKGQWFDVVAQNLDLGNGKTDIWESLKMGQGVATVALDDDNNVCIGREYKVVHRDFIYTIAAGGINTDSEKVLKDQAIRELREEFGFNARRIEKIATVMNDGRSSLRWHIYLARDIYHDPLEKDPGEVIETLKVPIDEAIKLMLTNKTHSIALLGILLVKEKLKL
ncbi:MAG: NUDIX hydrolase [Candidatus Aenigmarchaeota archaeon]|nr:NUDIX hydrolase [Candidatus Aenigmarchaeota archaeon]